MRWNANPLYNILMAATLFVIHDSARAITPSGGSNRNNNNNFDLSFTSSLSLCSCRDCTHAWDQLAGHFTCGARIEYLIFQQGMVEEDACFLVSNQEWPDVCKQCDPTRCDGREPVAQAAPEFSESLSSLSTTTPTAALTAASPERIPVSATIPQQTSEKCGCGSCTDTVYNADAKGFPFSKRVEFLLQSFPEKYKDEQDACLQLAQVEFPNEFEACDPSRCSGNGMAALTGSDSTSITNTSNSTDSFAGSRKRTHLMDLYCFPPAEERTSYENVWSHYTVQVKSDPQGNKCGPSDNIFGTETVSLANNKKDLKLQFKKVGNDWQGSEVRILLPPLEGPFNYGSYSFSVKSIEVIDSITGQQIRSILPQSLILGLFTWDPTENYQVHENYNHEVDVEISRWNIPDNADAQFLVQPPGDPQSHRFFTGSYNGNTTKDGNVYQQAPRTYGFEWRPTEVEWYSNAGGGQRFTYSTEDALNAGQVDYVQCMPANVEVRINLWNLFGNTATPPPGMKDSHVLEVVIDDFKYTPNGLTAVPDGSTCSKDCHCRSETSECISNRCTPVVAVERTTPARGIRGSVEP